VAPRRNPHGSRPYGFHFYFAQNSHSRACQLFLFQKIFLTTTLSLYPAYHQGEKLNAAILKPHDTQAVEWLSYMRSFSLKCMAHLLFSGLGLRWKGDNIMRCLSAENPRQAGRAQSLAARRLLRRARLCHPAARRFRVGCTDWRQPSA